ncbi:MAG: VCBS repeat-containing protein [Bdellovibrionales bacterium]|nr:VCBS repeat-containing protein [Bdellovibrionales bacterium]
MSGISLGTNLFALNAKRYLSSNSDKLGQVYSRLASGQRINGASDDAAGLAVASSLRVQSRVYAQAGRNLQDGISAVNIADSTLENLSNVLLRLKELAEQSANGSFSTVQRQALDAEATQLTSEYNRIVASTKFNDIALLDPEISGLNVQLGFGSASNIQIDTVDELLRTVGTGTFTDLGDQLSGSGSILQAGDFDGDGITDAISYSGSSLTFNKGNGSGGFNTGSAFFSGSFSGSVIFYADIGDVDGDGDLDLVVAASTTGTNDDEGVYLFTNNGSGTFTLAQTFGAILDSQSYNGIKFGDFNGDDLLDVAYTGVSSKISVFLGQGGGGISYTTDYTIGSSVSSISDVADLNGDGIDDFITRFGLSTNSVYLGGSLSQTFSYRTMLSGDFNDDGVLDLIGVGASTTDLLLGDGNGEFSFSQTITSSGFHVNTFIDDFNNDGELDVLVGTAGVFLGDGRGDFSFKEGSDGPVANFLGDMDGDGVVDLIRFSGQVYLNNTTETTDIKRFNLTTRESSLEALDEIDQYQEKLTKQRSALGATMSRFESAARTLYDRVDNLQAAEGRIVDADIAVETAELTRLQILQEAAAAVLGQANIIPSLALELLTSRAPPGR